MISSLYRNLFLFIFALFFAIESALVLSANHAGKNNIEDVLALQSENFHRYVSIAEENLKKEASIFYRLVISKPKMVEIMSEAAQTRDERKLASLRGELYSLFEQDYVFLKSRGVRQLHFHLPNAVSFLRFHKPEEFGDSLIEIRESLQYVNEHRTPISCFENGCIYGAFRNVYPIFNKETFVGTVEASFSVLALRDSLRKVDHSSYLFLLKEKTISEKTPDDEKYRYEKSQFDGLVYETRTLSDAMIFSLKELYSINEKIREVANVKLREGKSFSLSTQDEDIYDGKTIIVAFEAIQNLNNETVGYLVNYDFANFLDILTDNANAYLSQLSAMLALASLILFLLLKNKIKKDALIKELVTHDMLTSIYNRQGLDEIMNQKIQESHRFGRNMSLIFFDIDFFKKVNDVYGHDIGDYVLINIAKLVSKNIRTSDIFARWGGEEFIIILPETSVEDAVVLANKLRRAIETRPFYEIKTLTCSFGVTQLRDKESKESIFKRVDALLYKAKESGRNRVMSDINS